MLAPIRSWLPPMSPPRHGSTRRADLAGFYERTFPEKLNAVQAMSPADLAKTLDFFGLFQWPAVSFVGFANNHSVHHRGQLAAYLRASGSTVPAIYGSSADAPMAVR